MFVLANYHQLVFKGIPKPLGWEVAEVFGKVFHDDYPMMIRSEANWKRDKEFHESFDKVIYFYRNPFDVIISLYYYIEKDKIRQKLINSGDIEYYKDPLIVELDHNELWKYIKEYILIYIQHLNQGYHHADVVLKYEELKKDPNLFKPAFLLCINSVGFTELFSLDRLREELCSVAIQ